MDHIYSNANVTISANCAKTCEDGFLQDRERLHESGYESLPFTCADGKVGEIVLCPFENRKEQLSFSEWYPRSPPIDSRAWIVQESFMSSRMLLFTEKQLFWLCDDTWGKEGGMVSRKAYYGLMEMSRRVQMWNFKKRKRC